MFKKTHFKIANTIIIFLTIFITCESLFTIIFISQETIHSFKQNINDSIDLSVNNCKLNIISTINATNQIVKKENTITNQDLNNLKQVSFCINGVIFYHLDGTIQNSSGMSGIPSLDAFVSDSSINQFFNNTDQDYFVSLRLNNIPSYYTSTFYDPSYGIISYIHKIYAANKLIGYLFVDISPYNLYQNFFDYTDYTYFNNYASYILFNEHDYFYYHENDKYENYLTEIKRNEIISSKDNKVFVVTKHIEEIDSNLVIVIPRNLFFQSLQNTILPIILITFAFIIIGIFIGIIISKQTVNSLINLKQKMENAPEYILHNQVDS